MDEEKQWREFLRGDHDPDTTEEERAYSRALVDALKSEQQRLGEGEAASHSSPSRETVIHVPAVSTCASLRWIGGLTVVLLLCWTWWPSP